MVLLHHQVQHSGPSFEWFDWVPILVAVLGIFWAYRGSLRQSALTHFAAFDIDELKEVLHQEYSWLDLIDRIGQTKRRRVQTNTPGNQAEVQMIDAEIRSLEVKVRETVNRTEGYWRLRVFNNDENAMVEYDGAKKNVLNSVEKYYLFIDDDDNTLLLNYLRDQARMRLEISHLYTKRKDQLKGEYGLGKKWWNWGD